MLKKMLPRNMARFLVGQLFHSSLLLDLRHFKPRYGMRNANFSVTEDKVQSPTIESPLC